MPDKAVADGEDVAAENLDNPGSEPGETEERIAFLEKEYRQLSSLFQYRWKQMPILLSLM